MSAPQEDLPGARPAPFDLTPPATAVLDTEGVVVGWTEGAEDLLGYPASEVLGTPVAALLAEPLAGSGADRPTGGAQAGLVTVRHRDGHRLSLGVQASRVAVPAGEQRWLVSAVDLGTTPWWGVSRSVLERFLTRSPFGMAVVGTDLRYIWINETLERMAGIPREQRVGRRMGEVLPLLDPASVEAQMRRVLDTGFPVLDFEYHGHTPADPGREHAYSTSFFRLDDAEGRVMGVCSMGVDVTERWRTRERLALLSESGGRIGSTLDIRRTAQELADVAVPRLADFVFVDLLESVLAGEEPAPVPAFGSPPLRRAAQRSLREGCPEAVVSVGELSGYLPSSPIVRGLVEGRAMLEPSLNAAGRPWLGNDVLRAESVRAFGLRSLMVVPVRARGVSLGVAVFVRQQREEPFHHEDLRLAEEFVSRAAVCLDNARRYTRERSATLALQHSLLPHELPVTTTLEVASRYLPARGQDGVGGDWFDVIALSGARTALVVGDVVGHGMNAAATMGRLRTAVHTLANMDLPPDELLARLDDLVIRLIEEETPEGGATATSVLGATCLYAVHDPITQRCTVARAGHLPPAVVTPQGEVTFPVLPAGPPLGLGSMPFEAAELDLAPGSLLVLFTDGLFESRGRDLDASLAVLADALEGPDRSPEQVCDTVLGRLGSNPLSDDLALLVARTHALGPGQVVSWDLRADPAVVSEARALVSGTLTAWGLDELLFTTELIVSELVTNAIRHAVGPVRLRLIRQSALICEVSDGSSTSPRLRHARTTDEGGRGMFLVAQLTRRWGTRYTSTGKIIWSEQTLPASRPAR
ncbi:SpoIIE family protein phosphatase [Kitasatospora sp. NPDC088346]|uniref:SpoIIE family protein phosphatase n=1 Tax=Kitasatospora sp. NPDC088346 TaxID=3364073 RepID=UPI0038283B28